MKTAVEWLHSEYERILGSVLVTPQQIIEMSDALENAKEIEKEQIINAYKADLHPCSDEDAEQYYKETFKQKQEHEDILCTCSKGKGIDFDEMGVAYCVSCQKQIN